MVEHHVDAAWLAHLRAAHQAWLGAVPEVVASEVRHLREAGRHADSWRAAGVVSFPLAGGTGTVVGVEDGRSSSDGVEPARLVDDLRHLDAVALARAFPRDHIGLTLGTTVERGGMARSVATKLTGHKTESVYRLCAIVCESDLAEGVARPGEPAAGRARRAGRDGRVPANALGSASPAQLIERNGAERRS